MNLFDQKLKKEGLSLDRDSIEILQVNLGKLCNLTCSHCHVEAGPTKTKENADQRVAEAIVELMDSLEAHTLDLTGGAPEMNPYFKYLVEEGSRRKLHIIDRCNLAIFFEEGYEWLPAFLAKYQVEIVASLPCYLQENVDSQRGRGVFDSSIQGLKVLNELGYGKQSSLKLNLVYNPTGPHLPPAQETLQNQYKERLLDDWGIVFNDLYTITNMPITRYQKYLKAIGKDEEYQQLLKTQFNSSTIDGLMCRNTLNVGWDGKVYDCDFNQALGWNIQNGKEMNIFDLKKKSLIGIPILTGEHCFGCTAGSGSSCQGQLH